MNVFCSEACFVTGQETALAIAKMGGTVHLVCRNKSRGTDACEKIMNESGTGYIVWLIFYVSTNEFPMNLYCKNYYIFQETRTCTFT